MNKETQESFIKASEGQIEAASKLVLSLQIIGIRWFCDEVDRRYAKSGEYRNEALNLRMELGI